MTIGMSVTVSDTVVPIIAVSATGSSSASASARRSRSSCVSSLRAWATMRRMPSGGGGVALGDHEEDVLQRVLVVSRLEHADALARQPRGQLACRGLRVAVDDDVKAVAEERHAPR